MSLSISIVELVSHRMGEKAELTVRITPEGGDIEIAYTRKITVASKMLFEIGNIGPGSIPYTLTKEQFDTLEYDARLWEAVKKGLDLLSYADNTKSTLTTKLRARGFDRYIAEDAVEYIGSLGYINEQRILERAVDQLANVKLYGKNRIKSELYKKGISREVLSEHLEDAFEAVDFEENLKKLLMKKCDPEYLDDRKYRESLYAAMYRLGYSVSDVRNAIDDLYE